MAMYDMGLHAKFHSRTLYRLKVIGRHNSQLLYGYTTTAAAVQHFLQPGSSEQKFNKD